MENVVVRQFDLKHLEDRIGEGFTPPCPYCHVPLAISRKEGGNGAVAFEYRCTTNSPECALKPGMAYLPWHRVILKAIQKRAVQLAIAGLGSVAGAGALGFGFNVIHLAHARSADTGIERQLDFLAGKAGNDFQRQLLSNLRTEYGQITREQKIDYKGGAESVLLMAHAADAAHNSIDGIAIFSPEAWSRDLYPYVLANERAANRGVHVRRIFVIPTGSEKSTITRFLQTMEDQQKRGINVFYAFQDEIQLIPFFSKNPFFACALFDGRFFGYNVTTDTMNGRHPNEAVVTWDPEEIKRKSPFPDIFTSQQYIYRFENRAKVEQQILAHQAPGPQQ